MTLAPGVGAAGFEDFDDQQDLDTLVRFDPVAELSGGAPAATWSFPGLGGGDYAYRVEADATASGGVAGPSRALSVFAGFGARDAAVAAVLVERKNSSGDVALGVGLLRDLGAGRSDGYALWLRPSDDTLELVRLDDEGATPLATAPLALNPSRDYRLGLVRTGGLLEARVHEEGSGDLVGSLSAPAAINWTDLRAGVLVVGSAYDDVASADFDRLFGGAPGADFDLDGVSDADEVLAGSDPGASAVPPVDPDGDGLASDFELSIGTDPFAADSDGDGLADGAELADGSFELPRVIDTGVSGARSLAVGDVDGDGDPDLVSTALQANRVAWHENLGAGVFGGPAILSASSAGAFDVLLVDVDGDDDLDVVASSFYDGKLVWFENQDGQGDFSGESPISAAAFGMTSLRVADLDADGDPDLLGSFVADGLLAWYENDGDGNFAAAETIADGIAQPLQVAPADLDGDGDPDVLAASTGDHTIAWYENTGDGFGARRLISDAVLQALAVAALDVDADGDLDVLSLSGLTGNLSWHENVDGVGGFGPPLPIAVGEVGTASLRVADLDGDGDGDLLTSADSAPGIRWRENLEGAAGFSELGTVAEAPDSGLAAVADLDGDGAPDVVRALGGAGEIVWYRQRNVSDPRVADSDGDGLPDGFEVAHGFAPLVADENSNGLADGLDDTDLDGLTNADEALAHTNPRLVDSDRDGLADGAELSLGTDPNQVDTDGDGLLDGAEVAHGTAPLDADSDGDGLLDGFEVRFGFDPLSPGEQDLDPDGDGLANLAEQAWRSDPLSADTDGDGESDGDEVALHGTDPLDADSDGDGLADGYERTHAFDPLDFDEDGNGVPDGRDDADGDGLANAAEVQAGTDPHAADADGDGLLDGFELGSGRFGPQRVISQLANGARAVRAADLDGDGDLDVLTASAIDDEIAWYENLDGAGEFGGQRLISTLADGAAAVFAADVDGDGDLDVLSASELDDEVAWYENLDGQGSFGGQRMVSQLADGASSVFAADVDGDGDVDVLSASVNDGKLSWYANLDGAGGLFAERVIAQVPDGARSVYAADLDGDGDPDVLSAAWRSNTISWHENSDGLGGFGPRRVVSSQASAASAVFAADVDGDGDLDVLSASVFDDKVAWYENLDGTGTFGEERLVSDAVNEAWAASAADVDGDGDVDVLTASELGDELAWFENRDGLGSFDDGTVVSQLADGAAWVEAADLDGDGDADLLGVSGFDDEVAWHAQREVGDPRLADSDGDGLPDGQEDSDGDGLDNLTEQALGTDALERDTDGDGSWDAFEVEHGSDPLDALDVPNVKVPALGGAWPLCLFAALLAGGRRIRHDR